MTVQWQNCYDDGWQGNIVPEAFSHPAKFSRGLIHRIYKHAIDMGWVESGDWVLDPFGGVALGGLDALGMGLNWIGVELEEKFVKLGEQNIALWNRQLNGWPNLGTARIVQGDSRYLLQHLYKDYADLVVGSPPYSTDQMGGGGNKHDKVIDAMKTGYGHTPGNLANLKEGSIDAVISSPPFMDCGNQINIEGKCRQVTRNRAEKEDAEVYGTSPGQLGSMKEGSFDMCVSSPPYEGSRIESDLQRRVANPNVPFSNDTGVRDYGNTNGNLGGTSGDTFWSASREIVQGCGTLLRPGAHAIWVCKDYIKKGRRVPFSDRWLALCESVGFTLVCRHQAMLIKEHGTQMTTYGDKKITTERKSFFRRLAESKGSPKIDNEDVICLVKE